MNPKKILRTIESYLNLKPIKMPKIEEDPKYLRGIGTAAVIQDETGLTIKIKDKSKLERLDEEFTHIVDIVSGTPTRILEYDCPVKYRNRFYDNVLIEALGYYGSKIVTPRRTPIRIKHEGLKESIERKEWKKLKDFYQGDLDLDRRTWHEIGYDLGEKIYRYIQKTGNKEPILSLLIKNRGGKKPFEVYKKILKQVTK
ncbi:hypothetical protein FJZ53_02700 [Candidatus Woesearchaeota archaeon]|nr:hypothetical protein [Candidatus Woesearchaeota archaeon]